MVAVGCGGWDGFFFGAFPQSPALEARLLIPVVYAGAVRVEWSQSSLYRLLWVHHKKVALAKAEPLDH
jgi:hypothetical protein